MTEHICSDGIHHRYFDALAESLFSDPFDPDHWVAVAHYADAARHVARVWMAHRGRPIDEWPLPCCPTAVMEETQPNPV